MENAESDVPLFGKTSAYQAAKQIVGKSESESAATYQEAVETLSKVAQLFQCLPKYDVIGMDNLVVLLRNELANIQHRTDDIDSINKLSARINVSRTHLSNFRDGGMVCMNIMNRLANIFGIRYLVENYTDQEQAIS